MTFKSFFVSRGECVFWRYLRPALSAHTAPGLNRGACTEALDWPVSAPIANAGRRALTHAQKVFEFALRQPLKHLKAVKNN